MTAVLYLPSNYRNSTRTRTYGRAETGEVSPKGLVSQTEDWDGRESATAMPSTIHYLYNQSTGEFRKKTMQEMIDEGLFIVGKGPQ
jgi:hypothetical protein